MQSKQLQEKTAHLNSSLDKVLGLAKKLQAEVGKQQALIQFTVEKNQKAINEFLQIAGYQYKVSHEEQPDGTYKLMLRPAVETTEEIVVGRNRLSYGERNALALALFMFSALKEKADLIVLDDPISSFDNNKKFAIVDLLFLRGADECFRGKTVVMLTHDMGPVIDVMKIGGIHKSAAFIRGLRTSPVRILSVTMAGSCLRSRSRTRTSKMPLRWPDREFPALTMCCLRRYT